MTRKEADALLATAGWYGGALNCRQIALDVICAAVAAERAARDATFLVDTIAEHKPGEWDLAPAAKLASEDALINFVSESQVVIGDVISVKVRDGVLRSGLRGDRPHDLVVFSDIPAGYPPGEYCHK